MIRTGAIPFLLASIVLAQAPAFAKGAKHNNQPQNSAPRNPAAHNPAPHNAQPVVVPHTNPPNPPKVEEKQPQVQHPQNPNVNGQQMPRPGEWLSKSQGMSPAEQQKALNNDPGFQKLPPQRQQQLRKQLEDFNKLPPAEKDRVIKNMQWFASLPAEKQQRLRDMQGKLREVPDDRRRMMQTALRSLRQMDPAQREQVLSSDRFKSMFSDNERDILRGLAEFSPANPAAQQTPAPEPTQPAAAK